MGKIEPQLILSCSDTASMCSIEYVDNRDDEYMYRGVEKGTLTLSGSWVFQHFSKMIQPSFTKIAITQQQIRIMRHNYY